VPLLGIEQGKVAVPALRERQFNGHVFIAHLHAAPSLTGDADERGQGSRVRAERMQVQRIDSFLRQTVEQGGEKGRFAAGTDDEIEIVTDVRTADEGSRPPLRHQRSDTEHRPVIPDRPDQETG
jgi:hypothetical protein